MNLEGFLNSIDVAANSRRTYAVGLKRWQRYLDAAHVTQPTAATVREYKRQLAADGLKPTTQANYLRALHRYYAYVAATGQGQDITAGVKSVKVDTQAHKLDYLTTQDIAALLDSIKASDPAAARDKALITTMLTTGLRTVEAARASVGDIRAVETPDGITPVLVVHGKGGTEKPVRLPPHTLALLKAYLAGRRARAGDPLFPSTAHRNSGEHMLAVSISRIVKSRLRDAGLSDRLTAHSLRHTAATQALLHGATLQETQYLLRHSSPATTEIYAGNITAGTNPAALFAEQALYSKEETGK